MPLERQIDEVHDSVTAVMMEMSFDRKIEELRARIAKLENQNVQKPTSRTRKTVSKPASAESTVNTSEVSVFQCTGMTQEDRRCAVTNVTPGVGAALGKSLPPTPPTCNRHTNCAGTYSPSTFTTKAIRSVANFQHTDQVIFVCNKELATKIADLLENDDYDKDDGPKVQGLKETQACKGLKELRLVTL